MLILLLLPLLLLDVGKLYHGTEAEHVRVSSVELGEDDFFGLLARFVGHNCGFLLDEAPLVLPQQMPALVVDVPSGFDRGVPLSDKQLIVCDFLFILPDRLLLQAT